MDPIASVSEELAEIDGQIADIFRALSNGFQKLEKVKDANRQSRQLEELTEKMRECKRLIKEFDREVKDMEGRNDPQTNKMLNEKKQSMIKELNSYVALKKQHTASLENNKRVDLFEGPNEELNEENVLLASSMTNQQLMDHGNQMMDDTDQAIERGKKIVQDTINVGTETAAALKAQTEQMSRIVNELDSIHFSIKKASKLVKEIGRQVATDKCIMALLTLIVIGVIAIIIVKLVNPNNKDIRDIPGLAPPAQARRLLWAEYSKANFQNYCTILLNSFDSKRAGMVIFFPEYSN
ncbi:putative plant SNARE 11 [Turnera subulata]|uniref:Plant SNARE 11 n=1 Tax=Turnera subulata TaxID=218843 RepID=A0A9Q0GEA2_9ROSI|nr:putative plant SNARE 11 [Turnera subulata]